MKFTIEQKFRAAFFSGRAWLGLEAALIVRFQGDTQDPWDSPLSALNPSEGRLVPPQVRGEIKRLGN
ncbi:hypothetical protein KKP04_14815 [Rhodomicrobium sp. Az07]|uniref:hypothetical protein n=1 Tax=Rhodomicrobium sp. Az07 TaxID=2839034 RepID=UPI001BEBB316|nr:hypothetical protein [Rhodomicrobium sp. Az07]MBT3072125.1 hypothetical protein [Rhodomicrobium sp. Az07]